MKKLSGKKPVVSGKTARASSPKPATAAGEDQRPHYDFDYAKSRPNRFAGKMAEGAIAVVLDSDVAAVFRSSEAVNAFLRSAITAMPQEDRPKKRSAS